MQRNALGVMGLTPFLIQVDAAVHANIMEMAWYIKHMHEKMIQFN